MKRVCAVLVFVLGLTWVCSGAPAAAPEAKVGFALSMTGAAAAYGETQKYGALLAVNEINSQAAQDGVKIAAIFEDDASQPQQGVNVFNRFVYADKVVMILAGC